jgi:hypothetical protein
VISTPAELIEAKGGPSAFATAIGVSDGSVRLMKHRNKLPRSVWPEVQQAFPEVTLAVLLKLERAAERQEDAA